MGAGSDRADLTSTGKVSFLTERTAVAVSESGGIQPYAILNKTQVTADLP